MIIRLASFFAVACLTLAATALLNSSTRPAGRSPEPESDTNPQTSNRLPAPERAVSFHARFSLN